MEPICPQERCTYKPSKVLMSYPYVPGGTCHPTRFETMISKLDLQQNDPMVISVKIEDFVVRKTLADPGSSVDILYWGTFRKLKILDEEIQQYSKSIVGFLGERVHTKGYIDLFTKFGTGGMTRTINIRYLIIDAYTSYNILLGRPSLNTLGAVIFTYHLTMKFPSASGDIITMHVAQSTERGCYADSLKERRRLPPRRTVNNVEKVPGEEGVDLTCEVRPTSRIY